MRRTLIVLVAVAVTMGALAAPALADSDRLNGPDPAIWLSDPDGVDGDSGIEQGDPVIGASGSVKLRSDGAKIKLRSTGLEPGHTYTLWVVYFSDSTQCADRGSGVAGCNGEDLRFADGGVIFGDGAIAKPNGRATFKLVLTTGAGAADVGPPPPPWAAAPYQAGPDNEFHLVVRSHGPQLPGQVEEQISTWGGGCSVNVGPRPEQVGDFPVPLAPGECGDVQLYVFTPAAGEDDDDDHDNDDD